MHESMWNEEEQRYEPGPDTLYDQDDVYRGHEPAWNDQYGKEQRDQALVNEQLLIWEHEMSQPNYYDYFLEEMTR